MKPEASLSVKPALAPLRHGPKPWVVYSFLAIAIISLAAAFMMPLPKRTTPTAPDAQPTSYFDAPQFVLQERHGSEVRTEDLTGRVWIASFVFTRCTTGCPAVTATMKELQNDLKLAESDDLRLVTFTVDPDNDTLDKLKKYAEAFHAHESKWLFLTGQEKVVRPLMQKGFKITATKKENPKPGDEFEHSTKLFVVDKVGRVRATFDGMQGEHDSDGERYRTGLARLKDLVTELRKE